MGTGLFVRPNGLDPTCAVARRPEGGGIPRSAGWLRPGAGFAGASPRARAWRSPGARAAIDAKLIGAALSLTGRRMALTLGVWLCTLPFILLLLGPLLGWKVALLAAGGVLLALSLVCWSICAVNAGAS